MNERQFSTKFLHWLRVHKVLGAFELKLTKGISLPFNALQEHQKQALLLAKHGFLAHKIADDSLSSKPFDTFGISGPAYVVVQFYKPREKGFYIIDIDEWVDAEKNHDKKSITEEIASRIGTRYTFDIPKTSFL
jgi:hypothetical protein